MNQDDELREAGHFVIDHPGRKVCIYVNEMGEVVLMVEDDARVYTACNYDEIPALCAALMAAAKEAKPRADEVDAEYGAFHVIEKAKGKP